MKAPSDVRFAMETICLFFGSLFVAICAFDALLACLSGGCAL